MKPAAKAKTSPQKTQSQQRCSICTLVAWGLYKWPQTDTCKMPPKAFGAMWKRRNAWKRSRLGRTHIYSMYFHVQCMNPLILTFWLLRPSWPADFQDLSHLPAQFQHLPQLPMVLVAPWCPVAFAAFLAVLQHHRHHARRPWAAPLSRHRPQLRAMFWRLTSSAQNRWDESHGTLDSDSEGRWLTWLLSI